MGVSGANFGDTLGSAIPRDKSLEYLKANYNDIVISLYPDALYLDVKEAIRRSRLLERDLAFEYFVRGRDAQGAYQFDAAAVEALPSRKTSWVRTIRRY